ncbi:sortase [Clostridium polyendosporum]|uniref:Sortase n=1 Tax=Clostridium polyendosporum TaxID=69208 RepID=A0A919S2W1_9CLOT|nr:class D sortase [Clostridium polyendosporum]GIM30250.1 sortase [Clostridium polyendosporum]
MKKEKTLIHKSRKRARVGILLGIPILLFVCGIGLISVGGWNYMKQAYFLSRLFIRDEYNIENVATVKVDDNNIKFPYLGQEFGELIIESASIHYPVIQGDRDVDLLNGIAHSDSSRFPGENGNVVLAGHSETVFKNLGKVKKDDSIIFNTSYGKYVYKVSEIKIVEANDRTVTIPSDKEKLTIYTCYPFNTIGIPPQRYIVIGELIEGAMLLREGGSQ